MQTAPLVLTIMAVLFLKEVIGVFLRYTEGAYAVNYGNSSVGLFTNLPEMLDKAVISRVQGRFKIDGARTEHDFLDQDYIWWKKFHKTMPDFVNMSDPSGYNYLADQGFVKSMGDVLSSIEKPTDERVHEVYDRVEQQYKTNEHMFFASLYKEITARELMQNPPEVITLGQDKMTAVMKKFEETAAWNLPVVTKEPIMVLFPNQNFV